MQSNIVNLLLVLLGTVVLAGCSSKTETGKPALINPTLTSLNSEQQAQQKLAIAAKDKLFASLLGELMKSMGEKGPAKSIGVCKTRAPEIAASVGEESGVRIGRTSIKLRNADNQPPDWAVQFVNNEVETETCVALPGNGLGVLLPIRLMATCTVCHGGKDQVSPDVKAAIVSSYPTDQATGYAEGDLRGYFWVEVPKLDD